MPLRASAETLSRGPSLLQMQHDVDPSARVVLEAPSRPQSVGPVFDEEHASQPVMAWDEIMKNVNYTERLTANLSAQAPPEPPNFPDKYLFPMMTRNERERLTMLWYYTRNIAQDLDLMQRLQEKIDLVKDYMGWDFAIMGILSNNNYIRIATAGLPLAILPRRESTCSHTVNQQAGSVFWLEDMASDWRFKDSPHVAIGGLRSYAGTQLRFRTTSGEDVALGSLCIASNTANAPLTQQKKDALVKFAAMFTDELINGARIARHRMRQRMTELIGHIQQQADEPDIAQIVMNVVQEIYPNTLISIQPSASGMINIRGREPISYHNMVDGLWEDSEYIDRLLVTHNHEHLMPTQTVRAIVARCGQLPVPKYLVMDCMDLELVFDDIDAWFFERCALMLCNIMQKRFLEEALKAKETFLRGITHQLRTPIHGVLASSELLAEELDIRDSLINLEPRNIDRYMSHKENAASILATINSSGRELMSTVNNILKLNRWASISADNRQFAMYKLDDLETDIYKDIEEALPASDYSHVSIFFDNQIESGTLIRTDPNLLRECLSSLVLNALAFTKEGFVRVIVSSTIDALNIDIVDTGRGVCEDDHERIFEAYEKAAGQGRGAGLGLTLATKIALALNGTIRLVTSAPGSGSHFRASFANPDFSVESVNGYVNSRKSLDSLPRHYCVLPNSYKTTSLIQPFADYLEHRGFTREDCSAKSLVLLDYTSDGDVLETVHSRTSKEQVMVCLLPAGASPDSLKGINMEREVLFCSGPFFTVRLDSLLKEVNARYRSRAAAAAIEQNPLSIPSSLNDRRASASSQLSGSLPYDSDMSIAHAKKDPERFSDTLPSALLVDDNSINLHILRVYCEKRGIPYVTAMDGNEAVEAFSSAQEEPINLILMDLQMPNLDGCDATSKIRTLESQAAVLGRKPAVIFMVTGQDSPSDRHRSSDAGADAFYVKPVGIKALDAAIARYFRKFRPGGGGRGVGQGGREGARARRKSSLAALNGGMGGLSEEGGRGVVGVNGEGGQGYGGVHAGHKRRTVA